MCLGSMPEVMTLWLTTVTEPVWPRYPRGVSTPSAIRALTFCMSYFSTISLLRASTTMMTTLSGAAGGLGLAAAPVCGPAMPAHARAPAASRTRRRRRAMTCPFVRATSRAPQAIPERYPPDVICATPHVSFGPVRRAPRYRGWDRAAHAAAAAREETPSLVRMLETWRCTVWVLRMSRSAICASVQPSATRPSTSSSRGDRTGWSMVGDLSWVVDADGSWPARNARVAEVTSDGSPSQGKC